MVIFIPWDRMRKKDITNKKQIQAYHELPKYFFEQISLATSKVNPTPKNHRFHPEKKVG